MLRSFDSLRRTATDALIAAEAGCVALSGGGGDYRMPWHWHDCLMLLLPSVGCLDLRYEDQREGAWVSEDRFAIVPANHAHTTHAFHTAHTHVALYVTGDALRHIEADLGSLSRIKRRIGSTALFRTTPEIRSLQNLCRNDKGQPLGRAQARSHLSAALLIRCLAEIETSDPLPSATHRGHGAALVSALKAFVSQHVEQDIALDALAETFGVSRRHMTRLFRERTGLSLGDFHQSARLDTARRLLVETDLPVGEIAFRVGFESGSALSRAMRRLDGRSPTVVRSGLARSVKP